MGRREKMKDKLELRKKEEIRERNGGRRIGEEERKMGRKREEKY